MAVIVILARDNQGPHLCIGREDREERVSSKHMSMTEYIPVGVTLHERKRETKKWTVKFHS